MALRILAFLTAFFAATAVTATDASQSADDPVAAWQADPSRIFASSEIDSPLCAGSRGPSWCSRIPPPTPGSASRSSF